MTKRKANAPTAQAAYPAKSQPAMRRHLLCRLPWRFHMHEEEGTSPSRLLREIEEIDTGLGGIHAITTLLRNQDSIASSMEEQGLTESDILSRDVVGGLYDALEVMGSHCQRRIENIRDRLLAGEGQ